MTLPLPTIASTVLTTPAVSFQHTVRKLARMIPDPHCSPGLVAAVVGSDPMLSALVLSRANAALPADQPRFTQLTAAIVYLGLGMVHGLLGEVLPIAKHQRRHLATAWALANATGTMSRLLAGLCSSALSIKKDEETLHACGLLHDLGTVVAQTAFPHAVEAAGREATHAGISFDEACRRILGLHPGGLGALIARSWCLPPPLSTCMRFHYRPLKAKQQVSVVCLVHIARALVRGCGFTIAADPYVEPIVPEAMDVLSLRITDLEAALRMFHEEMEELETYESVLGSESRTDKPAVAPGSHG